MKKIYTKPELYYENFALIEAISSCDLISNFNQASGCVAYYQDTGNPLFSGWVFADALQGCTSITPPSGNECYGNPTPGYVIYASQ